MARMRVIPIALAVVVLLFTMTATVGAGDGADAPCPDFFYQDPLPIDDWPVLAAADANTAWAVSLGGLIIKTADGGATWEYQWSDLQAAPDTPPLRDVCAVNTEVAWICGDGGAVLLTEDGGATWQDKSIAVPMQSFRLLGISALNRNVAWVVGQEGSVYRTSDGGDNWVSCPVPGAAQDITGVSALGNLSAWVSGGNNLAAVTTDGGTSWTPRDPAVGNGSAIQRIKAFDADHVYAIGENGNFFRTANGGTSWGLTDLGANHSLCGMSFSDAQHGWVSGTINGEAGYMAVTSNGGQSWTRVDPPQLDEERNVTSIGVGSMDTIWSCTVDGALLRSGDGGGSWARSDTVWTREASAAYALSTRGGRGRLEPAGRYCGPSMAAGPGWSKLPTSTRHCSSVDAADSSTAWAVGVERHHREDGRLRHHLDPAGIGHRRRPQPRRRAQRQRGLGLRQQTRITVSSCIPLTGGAPGRPRMSWRARASPPSRPGCREVWFGSVEEVRNSVTSTAPRTAAVPGRDAYLPRRSRSSTYRILKTSSPSTRTSAWRW